MKFKINEFSRDLDNSIVKLLKKYNYELKKIIIYKKLVGKYKLIGDNIDVIIKLKDLKDLKD